MPLFPPARLCFIHIPKTGGTSVEEYLKHRYSVDLNRSTLFGTPRVNGHNQQHCTLPEIKRLSNEVASGEYDLFAVVRHPYTRALSDLFYFGFLYGTKHTDDSVLRALNKFWRRLDAHDNHPLSQLRFIVENHGDPTPSPRVMVLHMETLTDEMRNRMGFLDFGHRVNANAQAGVNYHALLTDRVKEAIYDKYREDFQSLGYSRDHLDPPEQRLGPTKYQPKTAVLDESSRWSWRWSDRTVDLLVLVVNIVFWMFIVFMCRRHHEHGQGVKAMHSSD